jgi:hypothetical protein
VIVAFENAMGEWRFFLEVTFFVAGIAISAVGEQDLEGLV